jgi:hypothetical protein
MTPYRSIFSRRYQALASSLAMPLWRTAARLTAVGLTFFAHSLLAYNYQPQGALVGNTEGNYGLTGGSGPSFYGYQYNTAGYINWGLPFTCNFFFQFEARGTESIVAATCTVDEGSTAGVVGVDDYPGSAVTSMNFSSGAFSVSGGQSIAVTTYLTVNSGGTYGASDSNTYTAPNGTTQQGVLNITWGQTSFVYDGAFHQPTATFSRADSGGNSYTPQATVTVTSNAGNEPNVGTYTATVSFNDSSFVFGSGQPITQTFTITPAPVVAPTSSNVTIAPGQSWSPSPSGGSGGSTYVYSVVGRTNWATTGSSWTPGAGDAGTSFPFYVGLEADGNHSAGSTDPNLPGATFNFSGPYTVTVEPYATGVNSHNTTTTVGTNWSPPVDSAGSGGNGVYTWYVVGQTSLGQTNWAVSSANAGNSYQFYWVMETDGSHAGNYTYNGQPAVITGPWTVTVLSLPTGSVTITPTSTQQPGAYTVAWTTSNATSASISGNGVSSSSLSGSQSVSNVTQGTYTYTLTATGPGGSNTSSASITISAPPPVTTSISANPTSGTAPASSTISWSSSNATSVSVTGTGLSSSAGSGSQSVGPLGTGTYTYTINASGPGGSSSNSATFTVAAPPSAFFTLSPSGTVQLPDAARDTMAEGPLAISGLSVSSSQVFTIQNSGGVTGHVTGLGVSGAGSACFTIQNMPSLPYAVGPGGSLTITVVFTPGYMGASAPYGAVPNATLSVATDNNSPPSATLAGNCRAPKASVTWHP